MKYTAALPEHNDNVSHEHPLKDFFLILSALVAVAVLSFWLLGLMIDFVVDRLSPEAEARLNRLIATNASTATKRDAGREARLQALVDGMKACAQVNVPARVTLVSSTHPNAAVVPGGSIIVFAGLIDKVKSENGLSFVLAHELAHVANRDHLRAMGRGIVLYGISAMLTGSDSGVSQMLAPVGHLGQSSYSRERESFADDKALRILHCRYGHAGGATELFDALKPDEAGMVGMSHYLSSHPSTQDRINAVKASIRAQGMRSGPVTPMSGM
jgi:predicted Zn-dependent protease